MHAFCRQSLREQLKRGDKTLVGNKGYRKYLTAPKAGKHFQIDEDKIREERRYDGIWVLQTDLDNLEEITVRAGRQAFVIRSETRGDAGKAIQAAGVALGPVIRPLHGTK